MTQLFIRLQGLPTWQPIRWVYSAGVVEVRSGGEGACPFAGP